MATRIWIFNDKERGQYLSKHPEEQIPWGVAIPDGHEGEAGIRPTRGPDVVIMHSLPEIRLFEYDDLMSITFTDSGTKLMLGQTNIVDNVVPEQDTDDSGFQGSSFKGYLN
jgi:hypothetical protein